jgi:hypothetical protein
MITHQLHHWRHHAHTVMRTASRRPGRPVAVLGAVTAALLSFTTTAFASTPVPPPGGQFGPVPGRGTATLTRVITTGGMPGWQIALIAAGAALAAAAVAILLDRALTRRRPLSAMTT